MPAKSHAVSSPSGSRRSSSQFQIGLILPDVLGTYGDDGNALIVRQRLRLRGVAAEIIPIHLGDPVPDSLDLYTVGGGEDTAQILASEHLRADGGNYSRREQRHPDSCYLRWSAGIWAILPRLRFHGGWPWTAGRDNVEPEGPHDRRTPIGAASS